MENLRDIVELFAYDLRDGIPWVIFWREGRSWDGDYIYLDSISDTIESDDMDRLEQISRLDPGAVALNGYYCGRLGEDMSLDELTQGVRWHYEHGYNLLSDFIAGHTAAILPEQVEETKQNMTKNEKENGDMSTTTYPPVYMESLLHSRENDQLDDFKASQELNIACAKMINKAIYDSNHGAHAYNMGEAAKQVVEQYGLERAKIVLANTVQLKLDDGRFSSPNKEWAEKVALPDMRPNMRYNFSIETHPALLNGFIDTMKDMEHVAEKSATAEKKPSVLGQLQKNMDTIAHADTKPPAPGKTKQDKAL